MNASGQGAPVAPLPARPLQRLLVCAAVELVLVPEHLTDKLGLARWCLSAP